MGERIWESEILGERICRESEFWESEFWESGFGGANMGERNFGEEMWWSENYWKSDVWESENITDIFALPSLLDFALRFVFCSPATCQGWSVHP